MDDKDILLLHQTGQYNREWPQQIWKPIKCYRKSGRDVSRFPVKIPYNLVKYSKDEFLDNANLDYYFLNFPRQVGLCFEL